MIISVTGLLMAVGFYFCEEIRVHREYHRPSISRCRTSSHNVVSGAPYHMKETNSLTLGRYQFTYYTQKLNSLVSGSTLVEGRNWNDFYCQASHNHIIFNIIFKTVTIFYRYC